MYSIPKTSLFNKRQEFKDETFDYIIKEENLTLVKGITFNNCIFKLPVFLKNIKSTENITFLNCTFSLTTELIDCSFKIIFFSIGTFKNTVKPKLIIQGCAAEIVNITHFNGYELTLNCEARSVIFENCTLEKLKLKDINTQYLPHYTKVVVQDSIIKKLDVENSITQSDYIFLNGKYEFLSLEGEFKNPVSFEGKIKVENLFFESCTFNKRIDIKAGSYEYLNFYRSYFQGLIWIYGYDILENKPKELNIKKISLHESTFDKNFSISLRTLEGINLSNNNFKQLLSVNTYSEGRDRKKSLSINFDGTNQGNVFFENINAFVGISGINFGNINFKNFHSHHLRFHEFQNEGLISFSNIVDADLLVITNSIIGNTEFSGIDVKLFEEIVIANSNLNGINFSNYPFKVYSYATDPRFGYGIKQKSKWNSNLKNVYNQLKKAASNKGDIDTAIKYQALEYKYLKKEKNFGFDKILLSVNQLSNNFGQSWSRAILFTLFIGLIFFKIYTFTNCLVYDGDLFWSQYIIYISSFPKLEIENISKPPNWQVSLVVWLSRIFFSYGIYQTISAFRKYGKL